MGFDLRDFDPHSDPSKHGAADAYRSRRAERHSSEAGSLTSGEISSAEVVQPDGSRSYIVKDQRTGVQFSAPTNNEQRFTAGQVVTLANQQNGSVIVAGPVAGEKGKGNAAIESRQGTLDAFAITKATPNQLEPDQTETVELTGYGFEAGDVLTAVLSDGVTVDPNVTLGTSNLLSSTQRTVLVTVGENVQPGHFIGFDLSRA